MAFKILIIDDKKIFCDGLSRMLINQGYVVDYAFNSVTALNIIKEKKYDLILLDVNLPEKSGIELLPEIMTVSNSYIIMITAYPDIVSRLKTLAQYPHDYWIKSSKFDELLIKIKKVLKIPEI